MLKLARTLPELYLPLVRFDRSEDDYEITNPVNISREFRTRTLFLGIPGAFFPSVLWKILPEYKRYGPEIREVCQVDKIAVVSVNDPFVLKNFAEEIDGFEAFDYICDFNSELSQHLGSCFEFSGFGTRTKPFRMILKDGEITSWVCEDNWNFTSLARPYKLMREYSPYTPYPASVYPD